MAAFVEQRRRDVERINAMTAKDTTVSGRVLIVGTGELVVPVVFPVAFSNQPFFTYGYGLDREIPQQLVSGRYPTVGATAFDWVVVKAVTGAFDGYFTGCSLALRVEGSGADQRLWVDWTFREVAIRNPIMRGDEGL